MYTYGCLPHCKATMHVKMLQSCLTLRPYGLYPTGLLCPWDPPGRNPEVGCHFLLQQIFPTQRLYSGLLCLLHWQVDSLSLVPHGKPQKKKKKEWYVPSISRAGIFTELNTGEVSLKQMGALSP